MVLVETCPLYGETGIVDRSDGMGHERWFRGQHDGQNRPFDWLTAARQRGIPWQHAQALYEQAEQQARAQHGAADQVQETYLALLADARRDVSRPSPGKVTRTMLLQAERASKKRPQSNISRLTGRPIAPGKRTLTSYIEPARDERRVSDLQRASDGLSTQDISVPDKLSDRRLQADLAAALGHVEELEALEAESIDAEPATSMETSQPSDADGGDIASSDMDRWPLPPQLQFTLEWHAREWLTNVREIHPDDSRPEPSADHAWTAGGMPFPAGRPVEGWGVPGPIQAKAMQEIPDAPVSLPSQGGGTELPEDVRLKMEAAFGVDFSQVRIHEGLHAEAIGAQAFTQGTDIHFAPGQYQPSSQSGQALLGHELAHVVQQAEGRVKATTHAKGVEINDDGSLEREADEMGARAARGERRGRAGVQLQRDVESTSATRTPRPAESSQGQSGADPLPEPGSRSASVQRRIRVGSTVLDRAAVRRTVDALVRTYLRDIIPRPVPESLVRETVRELDTSTSTFSFPTAAALADNVRQRVLASHYMRRSQGSTPHNMAFSYPNSRNDGTVGIGPKVNDAATAYWTGPIGHYHFDLTPAGRADAYQAIMNLFVEHTEPRRRTLIHCDYVVSVIRVRAYAETIGRAEFNRLVVTGALPLQLEWNMFEVMERAQGRGGRTPPLQTVTVRSRDDLVIGDHVVFYNHPSYDPLIAGTRGVWRLENAIVIDRRGGELRYQGHGYFSPVTEAQLIRGMLHHYNIHVDDALALARRTERGSAADRTAAEAEMRRRFPNVRRAAGGWEIRGTGFGVPVTRELRHLTAAEAPGLVHPRHGAINVRRPVEASL